MPTLLAAGAVPFEEADDVGGGLPLLREVEFGEVYVAADSPIDPGGQPKQGHGVEEAGSDELVVEELVVDEQEPATVIPLKQP